MVRTKLLGGRAGDNVKEVVKTLNRTKGRNWPVQQTTGSFGINVLRVALTKSVEVRPPAKSALQILTSDELNELIAFSFRTFRSNRGSLFLRFLSLSPAELSASS